MLLLAISHALVTRKAEHVAEARTAGGGALAGPLSGVPRRAANAADKDWWILDPDRATPAMMEVAACEVCPNPALPTLVQGGGPSGALACLAEPEAGRPFITCPRAAARGAELACTVCGSAPDAPYLEFVPGPERIGNAAPNWQTMGYGPLHGPPPHLAPLLDRAADGSLRRELAALERAAADLDPDRADDASETRQAYAPQVRSQLQKQRDAALAKAETLRAQVEEAERYLRDYPSRAGVWDGASAHAPHDQRYYGFSLVLGLQARCTTAADAQSTAERLQAAWPGHRGLGFLCAPSPGREQLARAAEELERRAFGKCPCPDFFARFVQADGTCATSATTGGVECAWPPAEQRLAAAEVCTAQRPAAGRQLVAGESTERFVVQSPEGLKCVDRAHVPAEAARDSQVLEVTACPYGRRFSPDKGCEVPQLVTEERNARDARYPGLSNHRLTYVSWTGDA